MRILGTPWLRRTRRRRRTRRHTTPPRFAHRAIEGNARRIEGRIPNPSRRSARGSETAREERLFNDLIFRIFFHPGLIFL